MTTRTLSRPRPAARRGDEFSRSTPLRPATPAMRPHPSPLALPGEALRRAVAQRLEAFGASVAQAVRADVREGEVTLTGAVAFEYERQTIELTIGRIAGVRRLNNLISAGSTALPVALTPADVAVSSLRWRWLAAAGAAVAAAALAWGVWQRASPGDAVNRLAAWTPVSSNHAGCLMPTAGCGLTASTAMRERMLCSARLPACGSA